jgi:hypothetical protein
MTVPDTVAACSNADDPIAFAIALVIVIVAATFCLFFLSNTTDIFKDK